MNDGDLILYAHPFSSYCQKALIGFYERDLPFTYRSMETPGVAEELRALWPLGKFPLLVAGKQVMPEATVILEYLDVHHAGGVRLIPAEADAAIEVRLWDRFFDNYVMTPMNAHVANALRPADARDAHGVANANATLDVAYAQLDRRLAGREWVTADVFTMADAAAAPALLYADWVRPIPEDLAALRAYRRRLLKRPSYARALDEARPYRARGYFPLGAPQGRD